MMAVRLSFLAFGRPSNIAPLTVFHGMLGSARNWRSLGPRMADRLGRMVYILDTRNHGESPHVPEMTFDLMARDTVEFLKEREIERTVLVGHSLGGALAMFTTLRYPQLVERLVVLDTTPVRPRGKVSSVDMLLSHLRALDISKLSNRREADRLLQDKIPSASLRDFLLTNLYADQETGQLRWRANLDVLHKALPHLTTFPDVGGAIYPGPTLFIGGGNSDVVKEEHIPRIKQLFPSSDVQFIPEAGHLLHVEKPEQFLVALIDFIGAKL